MNNLTLGKKIKAIRAYKGFSQEDMAHELDISLSSYRRIEQDITDTSLSSLEKIANILKVTPIDILAYGSNYLTEEKYKKQWEDLENEIRKFEKELREKDKEIISKEKEIISKDKKIIALQKKILKGNKAKGKKN